MFVNSNKKMTNRFNAAASCLLIALCTKSMAVAQEYGEGGLAGVYDKYLTEAVENGHIEQSVKDDILPHYQDAQQLLGEAFHSQGATVTRAIGKGSGLAGAVQKSMVENFAEVPPADPSDAHPVTTYTTTTTTKTNTLIVQSRGLALETLPVINGEIALACNNAGGSIDSTGVTERDLNNDGALDIIVGHDAINCGGAFGISMFCGAQVCSTKIFLGASDGFTQHHEILGILANVSNDRVPVLQFHTHGGGQVSLTWDGARFSRN